jgi:DNA-nicking Smr family endonuclease
MEHIITDKTPILDLHGETSNMVSALVNQFIKDCLACRNYEARIVHGKSTNILTKEVHSSLKKNVNVEKYFLNNWNLGETIIYLKMTK